MTASLKAHQKEGVAWIVQQLEHGGGVVLADDVGMGKTRQGARVLHAFMQRATDRKQPFKALVLAPASLLRDERVEWLRELQRLPGRAPLVWTFLGARVQPFTSEVTRAGRRVQLLEVWSGP